MSPPSAPPTGTRANALDAQATCVYDFVQIPTGADDALGAACVLDEPVWHDGTQADAAYTGELRCRLTALTPLLVGNERPERTDDADGQAGGELRPLTLPGAGGRKGAVLLSGASLKGMLRHSIGALLAAPMERVAERTFSYRPNIDFGDLRRPVAAVIEDITWDGDQIRTLSVRLGADIRDCVFGMNGVGDTLDHLPGGAAKADKEIVGVQYFVGGNHVKKLKREPGQTWTPTVDHRIFPTTGTLDGAGWLKEAFDQSKTHQPPPAGPETHVKTHILIPTSRLGGAIPVPGEVIWHLNRSRAHLADQALGHLRNTHPLHKQVRRLLDRPALRPSNGESAATRLRRQVAEATGPATWAIGRCVFAEVEQVNGRLAIRSLGHHFRYRATNTDTVRTRMLPGTSSSDPVAAVRALLSAHPRECDQTSDGAPARLTGARLLFGYARDARADSRTQDAAGRMIGKDKTAYERLAGRINVNFAVEENATRSDAERFLGTGPEFATNLPILGQPKPSSAELYLKQDGRRREDAATLTTWGDIASDKGGGEIRGRKFYPHQLDVQRAWQGGGKAFLVSREKTTFTFTVTFRALRPWEMGVLLAALQPERLDPGAAADDYAVKLGYGRPLGWGSCSIEVAHALVFDAENRLVQLSGGELATAFDALKEKIDVRSEHVRKWLEIHRWKCRKERMYPGGNGQAILDFHTKIRRDHAGERRTPRRDR